MNFIKIIASLLLLLTLNAHLYAQGVNDKSIEMADILHQNGKIYLVVLVLITIFAGIIFLLIRIERKLKRLEEKITKE